MLLRRITKHIKKENWFAVFLDFLIVVVGVYIGIQVANWNDARIDEERRSQIINALMTNLEDSLNVQYRFINAIDTELLKWDTAYANGKKPVPYYHRIPGSDTAPDVWSTFEQMQLTDMFDPVTLFDLTYHYSELNGIGRKYLRYVIFVENEILPTEIKGNHGFYDVDGIIKPKYQANMDRLRDFSKETKTSAIWAQCLVYRLKAKRKFEQTCRRANYILDGMESNDKPLQKST